MKYWEGSNLAKCILLTRCDKNYHVKLSEKRCDAWYFHKDHLFEKTTGSRPLVIEMPWAATKIL